MMKLLVRSMPALLLTTACVLAAASVVAAADGATDAQQPDPAAGRLTFEQHVRPIFKRMCFHCHGEDDQHKGGLDLRLVRLMQTGGESGSALSPDDAEQSLLWQRIAADEMPEGTKKLSDEQKSTVRRWIEQGAATLRPEPANVEDARFSPDELAHWAFQPVTHPAVPHPPGYALATPVDGFIAQRLLERGIAFSSATDRRTLIRRATFDLTGLPPTPEEVEAFVADPSPNAYVRLIDRLLSSPQFGVRWARHWLDVAGFAESDGGPDDDTRRPYAWRYRDYVIDAYNSSKPVDEFLREQLAGDEMIEGDLDVTNARHRELLVATGFLRLAPDPTQTSNTLADRNLATANAIEVISSTMLGLTVGCAQCHNHKYDPITVDDYYRFRAVFDPIFPLQNWQQPGARLIDTTLDEVRAEVERIEAEAKRLEDDLNARRQAVGQEILERKLADVPDAAREATRAAVATPADQQTPEQKALLDQYPMVKPVSYIVGLLIEYDMPTYRRFEKEQEQIAALRATKPPLRMIMATTERSGVVPESAVFFRGDPESPRQSVSPGELTVLNHDWRHVSLPVDDECLATTGRRLAYARQLTDGTHPLTARVLVNRIWLHLMGRGLVATPSDFGLAGQPPSHPRLLDWLADDFVRHGWDQKRLHRLIMLSTTYQQQSVRSPELDAIDPDNELYARMNLRRLEAEAIRDALLAVSATLNCRLAGASVPVTTNDEGKAVIGRQKLRDGLPAGVDRQDADAYCRSIFVEVQRNVPLDMLATFDQPVMNPNCELRQPSTVAMQSLWFMNDELMVQTAEELARLLTVESGDDAERQVERLFVRLFATPPTDAERAACLEFLDQQADRFRRDPDPQWQAAIQQSPQAPRQHALASLCQSLIASNRFLYLE